VREAIIAMLRYPRTMVHGNIPVETCTHGGFYADGDLACMLCDHELECHWLANADEFSALEQRSLKELAEALEFAVDYVRAQVAHANHDFVRCKCEACDWLRTGQSWLDRAQESTLND